MEVIAVGDVVAGLPVPSFHDTCAGLGVIISRVGQCVAGLARPSDCIRIR